MWTYDFKIKLDSKCKLFPSSTICGKKELHEKGCGLGGRSSSLETCLVWEAIFNPSFPHLFRVSNKQSTSINQIRSPSLVIGLNWDFRIRRNLSDMEVEDLNSLLHPLQYFSLRWSILDYKSWVCDITVAKSYFEGKKAVKHLKRTVYGNQVQGKR